MARVGSDDSSNSVMAPTTVNASTREEKSLSSSVNIGAGNAIFDIERLKREIAEDRASSNWPDGAYDGE